MKLPKEPKLGFAWRYVVLPGIAGVVTEAVMNDSSFASQWSISIATITMVLIFLRDELRESRRWRRRREEQERRMRGEKS
jgi:hypothetical protein